MIRIEQHPLVRRDLRELVRHVADISGDPRAAARRLDQVEALLRDIMKAPNSGTLPGREPAGVAGTPWWRGPAHNDRVPPTTYVSRGAATDTQPLETI